MADKINPFQPSTSPWDQSFTAGGNRGQIIFPSAVPPNASPLVPIVLQTSYNAAGVSSPPATPSFWESTAIQLTMAGANGGITWVDQKFGMNPSTTASCNTSIAQSIFLGSSTFVDGNTASYRGLQFTNTPGFALGSNDFTVEGWFWANQADPALRQWAYLAAQGNSQGPPGDAPGGPGSWSIVLNAINTIDGKVQFSAPAHGITLIGTTKTNDARWHHVAACRTGVLWSLYIDGVREASTSASVTLVDTGRNLVFGGGYGFAPALRGYLSEWRVVNGVCVYTGSNFAVPTLPFPTS